MFHLYACYPPYLDASERNVYFQNVSYESTSLFVLTSVIISYCVLLLFVKVSLAAQKKWLECKAASMGGKKEDTDSLSQIAEENEEQRLYRQVMTVLLVYRCSIHQFMVNHDVALHSGKDNFRRVFLSVLLHVPPIVRYQRIFVWACLDACIYLGVLRFFYAICC